MCGGDFMSKNPEGSYGFLKLAAMTRRLEELELKRIHEVQAVAEAPVQVKLYPNCPITMRLMEIPTNSSWKESSKFSWKARATQYQQPDPPSQQSSSLKQAMANLSKAYKFEYTGKKKEDFLLNPTKTPKVSMKWKARRGNHRIRKMSKTDHSKECHDWRKVVEKALLDLGASVNLLPYSVYKQLGLGELKPTTITLSLADRSVKIPRGHQENCLMEVLKRCKKAIGWQISDLKGISPLVCTHHIYMEEEAKPIRQFQRRLNPHLQEVVRAEVLKLLQAGIIYPISDSPWVSPTQVVPKKSGITVVQNEKGEEITTRLTSGWRVCIDYRKLNAVTRKDHFPLPFIDQVLERVSGHPFYCFLDGRMPFGLCNAPATFQRCMLSIFSDMVERIMEVFMDDITVYGGTFEECLVNLEAVLHRCIEKDLVLNWEKCHFMVRQGIVLGHIISEKGIEVDKAKVELIVKLPSQQLSCAWPKEDGKPYVIYYASKTLNEAQRNYTTTEKELLAVVFALDKFRAYLVGSFIIVFTDHSALKYLLTKQDAKARLVIAHNSHPLPINDDFPEESLMFLVKTPWYAHIANYLVTGEIPNQIIRKCVPEDEQQGILSHCHENACGGHFASQKTAMKVLQSGFTWPSLFKDAHIMCRSCDRCQRLGKLTKRNQMPMNPILIVELFDVWGIDFMGPFPMSFGNSYILVGVDYVSKWVEAIPCKQNDHRVVLKFLKENIFSRFGVPKAIISDGGAHFCNKPFEALLSKYGVKHKVATPYHPQTSGQVELANREIKNILMKVVNSNRKDWSIRLHDSFLVGNKEAEHGLDQAGEKRYLDLNEMEELRNNAYINSKVAKQRMKKWHDQLISNKEFQEGQRVLLYDTRLHIFPGKLKSRWIGPFIIHRIFQWSGGIIEFQWQGALSQWISSQAIHGAIQTRKGGINLLEPQKA
ncbi:Retrovirus-related Pol polyprotein from transposon 297 [Vitis vinifera]|uniref:RNA-directed DNA polymerase n=1 Tax=Vitis vinifera TaxID=29760 RepID=A0A438FPN2_VITVI|nr:Retrovirus-related Pol polyprotein from transposon 297 [Vitis vinifera]